MLWLKMSVVIAGLNHILVLVSGKRDIPDNSKWMKWQPLCWFGECCNNEWITLDLQGMRKRIEADVFGQHLVQEIVYASIKGHFMYQPTKPLVLSFHGRPGTGKRYVSKIIAEFLFKKGSQSKFVNFRSATNNFWDKNDLTSYQMQLQKLVKERTSSCQWQLFILDEIDWFPPGLLDSLKTFLDTSEVVNGVDYRNSIFIFLSNAGQESITVRYIENMKDGKNREKLNSTEMEALLRKHIYEEEGKGFYESRLISSQVISHYVPFLPLEREHVEQCIRKEMTERRKSPTWVRLSDDEEKDVVQEVLGYLDFTKVDGEEAFATKGCKNVVEKLNLAHVKRDILRRHTEL